MTEPTRTAVATWIEKAKLKPDQCLFPSRLARFIQARLEREGCYELQVKELAAKRKPEPTAGTSMMKLLQEMRWEDDAIYKSLRSNCRGC